jgi:hypothetical protein
MIPLLYRRTLHNEELTCLVLSRNDMNIYTAMHSPGNGKVGKVLQKGFSMAYNMCHRSNKVKEDVVILQSHSGTMNPGPHYEKWLRGKGRVYTYGGMKNYDSS